MAEAGFFSVRALRWSTSAFGLVVCLLMPACALWGKRDVVPAAAPASAQTTTSVPPTAAAPPPVTPMPAPMASQSSPTKPADTLVKVAKAPNKTPPAVSPSAQPVRPVAAAGPAAPPAKSVPPALDLATLEQRLRDTKAIGVFTKLSLKNQVDDLLGEFKTFHETPGSGAPPQGLRTQYDLLMLKVLSLLQDGDPQLAATISSSREALWDILRDPAKFAKI